MKMNDKQYTLQETTVRDIGVNPFFENLDVDFVPSLKEKSDREYFRSDQGKLTQARIKTRNMWRETYGGKSFYRDYNREMRDDEVDAALVQYFKLNPDTPIDYYKIQEDLRRQRDLYYTGDFETLTGGEMFRGALGAFMEWGDNVKREALSLGIDLMSTGQALRTKQIGQSIPMATFQQMPFPGTTVPKEKREEEAKNIKDEATFLKLKVDQLEGLLEKFPSFKDDLEELRAKAGDEEANWFLSSFAATLANAPNLVAGGLGARLFGKSGWIFSMAGMYAQEKDSAFQYFKEIYDISSSTTLEEIKKDPTLSERYNQATKLARAYGLLSAGIEYIQTGGFLRMAGIKKGARPKTLSELFKNKPTREFITNLQGHIKRTTGMAIENIVEEVSQGILYNQFANMAITDAFLNYDIDKRDEMTPLFKDWEENSRSALQLTTILAPVGAFKNFMVQKNYRSKTVQRLKQQGFTHMEASEFALDLANAAGNKEEFKKVAARIQSQFESKEASKVILEKNKLRQTLEDDSGLKTMDGSVFTDQEFDALATTYSTEELIKMIPNKEYQDLFIAAVNGDMEARIEYNKSIQNIVNINNNKNKKRKETEIPPRIQKVITKIEDGELDKSLDIEEGETIEQAREKEINRILEKEGLKPREQETTEEAAEETTEETIPDQPTEVMPEDTSYNDVKTEAKKLGIPIKGKKAELINKINRERAKRGAEQQAKQFEDTPTKYQEKFQRKMAQVMQNSTRALRKIAPTVKILYAKSEEDYLRIVGRSSRGAYVASENTVYLNPSKATQGTVVHETVHAILQYKLGNDKNIQAVTNVLLNDILKDSISFAAKIRIRSYMDKYIKQLNFTEEAASEEGVSELAAILLDNINYVQPSLKARIIDFVSRIFGIDFKNDEMRAIKMLQAIASKTTKGEMILESDVSILDDIAKSTIPGYSNESQTAEANSKFQLSHTDPITGFTYEYDLPDGEFQELEDNGNVTKDQSITDFVDKFMAVTYPDSMFTGTITNENGDILVEGSGGINFVLKFHKGNYVWAAGKKSLAQGLLNRLNESFEDNNGVAYLALALGSREKLLSNTQANKGVINIIQDFINNKKISVTQEQFDKILKDVYGTNNILEIYEKLLPTNTEFSQRKAFALKIAGEIAKIAKDSEIEAILETANIPQTPLKFQEKAKPKEQSKAKLVRYFVEVMTEPFLTNTGITDEDQMIDKKEIGQIYAVIEIRKGATKAALSIQDVTNQPTVKQNESYPYIIQGDQDIKTKLHILKDRYPIHEVFVGKDGEVIEKNLPQKQVPNFGISKSTLRVVNPKFQLEDTQDQYQLNFDVIPQVKDALRQYFDGKISYEEFLRIQDKFDPIRRFEVLPELPTNQEMKDVLDEGKKEKVGIKPKDGEQVSLRLDIPAYTRKDKDGKRIGKYVVTIHKKGIQGVIGYTSTGRAKNVRMTSPKLRTAQIALKETPKGPVSAINGQYVEATDEQNYKDAQELINDPNWVQIGFNPFRRSFFYVREGALRGNPVVAADEVIQIGGLVLAKNITMASVENFKFNEKQKEQLEILRDDAKFQLDETKPKMFFGMAGIGTIEMAFANTEFRNLFNIKPAEYNQSIVDVHNAIHGTGYASQDFMDLDPNEFKDYVYWHASFPCQCFSASNPNGLKANGEPKQGNLTKADFDKEMQLAKHGAKIITTSKPLNVTIENVPNYQGSDQYAVLRKALQDAGYTIREEVVKAQDYGAISSRKRFIVQATLRKDKDGNPVLPPVPEQQGFGDWYKAIEKFIKDAPHYDTLQEKVKTKPAKYIQELLEKIDRKHRDARNKDIIFTEDIAYIATGDESNFSPQGLPGPAIQAGLRSDRDMSKGSKKIPKLLLPVRKLVQEQGVNAVAEMYGVHPSLVKEVYDSPFPFIIKRLSQQMLLAYMGLDPNLNLGLDKLTPSQITQLQILKAGLGNGVHEKTTMSHLKPMMQNFDNAPKFQLSDDEIDALLNQIDKEIEAEVNKEYDLAAKGAEKIGEQDYTSVDELYGDLVDLEEEEELEGKTRLTLRDAARLFDSFNLGTFSKEKQVNTFTGFAKAADINASIEDLLSLADLVLTGDTPILTDIQHYQMILGVTQLKNELEEIRNSEETGTIINLDADTRGSYETKLEQMEKLVRADTASGSRTGSALRARSVAANNDYSYYGVIRRATKMKRGMPLTKEEISKLAEVQAKYEKTRREVNKLRSKIEKLTNDEDISSAQSFFDQVLVEKEKFPKGKINKLIKEIKQTLKNKGYNLESSGKFQLGFGIDAKLAKDIRAYAKLLILEADVKTLNEVVALIKSDPEFMDVSDADIYGSISGRIQRVPRTKSEAQKRLQALTLQADLQVQINNALVGVFDPKRATKPPLEETKDLRKKLNKLKELAHDAATEDERADKILTQVRNIEEMIDGLYRPIKKPTKIKSDKIQAALDKLYTARAELRAQDRLLLLQTILEYGEPPKFTRQKRDPQSDRLEKLRTDIKLLEKQIRERKKVEADKERQKRIKAEQEQKLQDLSKQILGWYRDNVGPASKPELNETQKGIKEARRLQKQQDRIGELVEIIATGKLPPKNKKVEIADPMGFLKTIDTLKEELKNQEWYRQIQQNKYEEKRIEQVKQKIKEQEELIKSGDFTDYLTPKEKKEIDNPQLKALLLQQATNTRIIRKTINELRPRTRMELAGDIASLPRAFMATADMSGTFRQAFLMGVRDPKAFAKAFKYAAKAAVDPKFAEEVMFILESDTNAARRLESGLFFSNLDTGMIDSEESFSSNMLQKLYKIPGLGKPLSVVMGASERNMVVMLNVLRAAAFDKYCEAVPNATSNELKTFAHFINTMSGRGDLGKLEPAADGLSYLFFSPRFAASRLMVIPESVGIGVSPLVKKDKLGQLKTKQDREGDVRLAKEVAKYWGSLAVTTAIVFGLAALAGAEVGDEPDEPDFGKLIFGNMRLDIFAGVGQPMRLLAKALDSAYKTSTGQEVKLDLWKETQNTLIKYKVTPWVSGVIELLQGKDFVSRQDKSAMKVLLQRLAPITFSNLYENIYERDAEGYQIFTEFAAEFFGLSVYTQTRRGGSL